MIEFKKLSDEKAKPIVQRIRRQFSNWWHEQQGRTKRYVEGLQEAMRIVGHGGLARDDETTKARLEIYREIWEN